MEDKAKSGTGFKMGSTTPPSNEQNTANNNDEGNDRNTDTATSPTVQNVEVKQVIQERDESLDKVYIDKRTISISLVAFSSMYRIKNKNSLGPRREHIGSSLNSSKAMSSNTDELIAYYPKLLGISHNNVEFIERVKQYLNNIRVTIEEEGKTFDISFRYKRKADYLHVAREFERIEENFKRNSVGNITNVVDAVRERTRELIDLESTLYQYGEPVNLEEYLIYRHCLHYTPVAKAMEVIDRDKSIKFYIKDDNKEALKLKRHRTDIVRAKANYARLIGDSSEFQDVYIQYLAHTNRGIAYSLQKSEIEQEIELDHFSTDFPAKFNEICKNVDGSTVALIERLIAKGELTRSSFNQNISANDGTFIGSNMKETIAWFKSPENAETIRRFNNQLKH